MYAFFMRIILIYFLLIGTLFANEHILEQENFDAWQFTCVEEQKQKICELRELVFDPNT